jgi:hypothetical protein
MSETYFGGFDMGRFDFIDLYETRGTDIPHLATDLGLPLVADIHENRTSESVERRSLEADLPVQRQLTDLLSADAKFYERMRSVAGASRLGQTEFRLGLFGYWQGRCAITRTPLPELRRASHIKPWGHCSNNASVSTSIGASFSPLMGRDFRREARQ